jgi:cobalamin-dependent methionine synthase I
MIDYSKWDVIEATRWIKAHLPGAKVSGGVGNVSFSFRGAEAVRVFSDGKRLLQRLIEGRWLQAHGVVALLPANTVDDDTIEVYAAESRQQAVLRWSPLRLQTERPVVDGVRRAPTAAWRTSSPRDQVADWARRTGMDEAEARRALATVV